MKALPMLDHVMLGIAYTFVGLTIVAGCNATFGSFFYHNGILFNWENFLVLVALPLTWMACLWFRHNTPCHLFLGVSSFYFIASSAYSFFQAGFPTVAYTNSTIFFTFFVVKIMLIIGYSSLLWISLGQRLQKASSAPPNSSIPLNSV